MTVKEFGNFLAILFAINKTWQIIYSPKQEIMTDNIYKSE